MSGLRSFWQTMPSMLLGRTTVADAETELGPSPSGSENFEFYRVLVERNLFKAMFEMYWPVKTLALRQDARLWGQLVQAYTRDHPPTARGPNEFTQHFSDWLAERRKRLGDIPQLFEEVADFQWVNYSGHRAPDDLGDGFDERLFVRQYTHPVPKVIAALEKDREADLPGREPVVVVVYRHLRLSDMRLLYPTRLGLAVLARRQGADLPPGFGGFTDAELDETEVNMIEMGILVNR
jgi:hypothetical protein